MTPSTPRSDGRAHERPVRVLIADDHSIVREGLLSVLSRMSHVEVVGSVSDGRDAFDEVDASPPDVVLMDLSMPNLNGFEAIARITKAHPEVRVIAVSMHDDRRAVLGALEAGALAYVVKDVAAEDIADAIDAVMSNQRFISRSVVGLVIDGATGRGELGDGASRLDALGSREREVLQLIAEGRTSNEIATALGLSVHTVDTHRRNIMRKTRTHSVVDLTRLAIREGLTSA